ncbi:alpha/beta fold hydrolase [Streptosporangium sp. NBC_01810]|uniref:alpha/beta fold hydrolase n=1 Tax=Streptosporangium sp. NBC_01810 TaxID=2975951 RepID=UPI002DDC6B7F|nr:alpha/beta fold hydrolase [Streptosporangium sp. NBC_01810]WSA28151.1 alpha/beta fold hydrolase [Streptosporangium sp. NBC_01810]
MAPASVRRPRRRRPAGGKPVARVLLLHGLGCTTSMWEPLDRYLPDDVELWDVKLPWHGIESADWSRQCDPVSLLVDSMDTGEAGRFDAVVAHSYAANLLIEAMSEGRLAPGAVVLVSPFHRHSAADFDWPTISYYLNDFHRIFAEALDIGARGIPEVWRAAAALHVRDQIGVYGWMRFFEAYLRSPFVDLSTIDASVLVITGQDDIATRASDGRQLAAALPEGRFELIEDCGHFPMAQQPGRFASLVHGFLREALSLPIVSPITMPGVDVNPTAPQTPIAAGLAAGEPTTTTLRPRYEGSNICTWIGFKHVNYLVEEAVLDHLRQRGYPAGELYERYGICVDIADIDTRMWTAYHIDDVAVATVRPVASKGGAQLRFVVEMIAQRETPVKTVTSKVAVTLRNDPRGFPAEAAPAELGPHIVERLGERLGEPVAPIEIIGDDPLKQLIGDANAFGWVWRMPYFYCHFTERVQMTGYLRLMEEVVDLFLQERGVSIKTLLDEQNWIPVVPSSKVRILDEAWMENEVYTVFTVEEVFKRLTYTARMDCYVKRDGKLVQVATGKITHGYAVIENRRDWSQVDFDDRLAKALTGGAGSAARAGRGQ